MVGLARNTVPVVVTLFAIFAGGCGDDGGASGNNLALCANFEACGGDPVGTWELDSSCFDGNIEIPGCTAATFDIQISQTGTVVLNDDGSYTSSVVTEGFTEVSAPASCLMGITDCGLLNDPDEGVACTGNAEESCTCTSSLDDTDTDTGTWTTAGNTLTITSGGEPDVFEYCVSGSTMTIYQDDGDVTTAIRLRR